MGRIVAIDYGQKRVGIAVTDPLKIIAHALETVHSSEIFTYLTAYFAKETVEKIIVGSPKQMNNKDSESMRFVKPFVDKLKKTFPLIPVEMVDERFTSKMAFQSMIDSGVKKSDRRDKAAVDTVAAAIMLQDYLQSVQNKML